MIAYAASEFATGDLGAFITNSHRFTEVAAICLKKDSDSGFSYFGNDQLILIINRITGLLFLAEAEAKTTKGCFVK